MSTATAAPESAMLTILIGELRESPLNTRHAYNDQKMDELADSIKRHGVLTPLLVRPIRSGKEINCYEIAAGHRRYRGAKKAGLKELPCRVREMNDNEFLEILMIENLQREDVHELDEANGYKKLMETGGYDVPTLAAKVGKSEGYVYARMKLCDLIDEVQAKFYAGELTAGHAILLARLTEQGQIEAVKHGLYREQYDPTSEKHFKDLVSVRALSQWIQSNIHMELAKAPFSPKDEALVAGAGSCVNCPKRSGFNPQLFPELGKKDVCTDRKCFNQKIDAFIKGKIDSGEMVGLSDEYSNKKYPQWYSVPNAGGAGAKKCEHAIVGICVDGYEKGKTKKVCVTTTCKVHYASSGKPATSSNRRSDAAYERRERERKAKAQRERTFRSRIYKGIAESVDRAISAKQFRLKGAPLVAIADAVFDRLDYRDRKAVLEELGVKARANDYKNTALRKTFGSLSSELLAGVLVKLVARRNLQVSEYSVDYSDAAELLEIAEHYGVNHKKIRTELQTSAKTKAAAKKKGKR